MREQSRDYAENNAGEVRMLQQQVPGNLLSLHLHTNSSIAASGKHQQHLYRSVGVRVVGIVPRTATLGTYL